MLPADSSYRRRSIKISKVSFLIIDDHPVFRQGLVTLVQSMPQYSVLGEAGSFSETMALMEKKQPDIALVDIALAGQSGLDLVKSIYNSWPAVKCLIISIYDEAVYAERALKAHARGYVMKQEAASVMLEAIQTVQAGRVYLSMTMHERLIENLYCRGDSLENSALDRLTDRELEILKLIGQGNGIIESAALVNLSVKTVNSHRDNIRKKLNLANSTELRKFAINWLQSQHR